MSTKTDFHEAQVLDDYLVTPTVYIGLFTVAPTDSTAGTEVSGNAYARQSIAFTRTGSTVDNDSQITFPTATGSWGTVVAWGIFDAVSAGNLLYYGVVNPNQAVALDDQPFFAAGEIVISED